MLVGIALLSAAARAQRVGDSLLQDALELGRRAEPLPYTLPMNSAGSGDAGKVYTPLVCVAMASRAAHLSGNELSVSDLPDWLTEPTTYVVTRGSMVDACVQVDGRTCMGRSGVITQRDLNQWK